MAEPLFIRPGVLIPPGELTWRFSRSSGPGGQSVNTADSRASLSFDVARSNALPAYLRDRALDRLSTRLVGGVLTVHAERERSQLLNRSAAADRLAEILREAIAAPAAKRRPTKASRGSHDRRVKAKKERGQTKKLRQSKPGIHD